MKKLFSLKLIGLSVAVGIVMGSYVMANTEAEVTEPDYDAIVAAQQQDDEQLADHESRITASEGDIDTLQTQVSTTSSSGTTNSTSTTSQPTPTPSNPTPSDPPATQPTPVTIVSYRVIDIEGSEDKDCEITYSDGTTKRWRWQTVEYNQGTKITHTNGRCS